MRSLAKGRAPRRYQQYGDAKADLAKRLGWFCAYCEMPILNAPQLDHVIPVSKGGDKLNWKNFLLSCFHCNNIKRDHNDSRLGYLWPDTSNTSIAFEYSLHFIIRPSQKLAPITQRKAQALIDLTGLDRNSFNSSPRDKRWWSRDEAWRKAKELHKVWQANPSPSIAKAIQIAAHSTGFYSIWMTVFQKEAQVTQMIEASYKGTYKK